MVWSLSDLHCLLNLDIICLHLESISLAKGFSLCTVIACQSYHTHLGVIVMSIPGLVARATVGIVSTVIASVG